MINNGLPLSLLTDYWHTDYCLLAVAGGTHIQTEASALSMPIGYSYRFKRLQISDRLRRNPRQIKIGRAFS